MAVIQSQGRIDYSPIRSLYKSAYERDQVRLSEERLQYDKDKQAAADAAAKQKAGLDAFNASTEAAAPHVIAGDREAAEAASRAVYEAHGVDFPGLDDDDWPKLQALAAAQQQFGTTPKAGVGKDGEPEYFVMDQYGNKKTIDMSPEPDDQSEGAARREGIAGAVVGEVDRLRAEGLIPEDHQGLSEKQINDLAVVLDESGSLIETDDPGEQTINKLKLAVANALGIDAAHATTEIDSPARQRKRRRDNVQELSGKMLDSGLIELDSTLDTIEGRIAQSGGLDGFDMLSETAYAAIGPWAQTLITGDNPKAREDQRVLAELANQILNSRAGKSQTLPEQRRVLQEMGRGQFKSTEDVLMGLKAIRRLSNAQKDAIFAGYSAEVQQAYSDNLELARMRRLVEESPVNLNEEF